MNKRELFHKVIDTSGDFSKEELSDLINYLTAMYNVRFLQEMKAKLPTAKDDL